MNKPKWNQERLEALLEEMAEAIHDHATRTGDGMPWNCEYSLRLEAILCLYREWRNDRLDEVLS